MNKLDIGDGHIISVVKADFGNKTNPVEKQSFVKADSSHDMVHDGGMHFMKATTGGLHTVEAMDSKLKQSLQASHQEILQFIPPECEADKHALVVIFNAYDALRADNDDSYVESIEASKQAIHYFLYLMSNSIIFISIDGYSASVLQLWKNQLHSVISSSFIYCGSNLIR